MVLFLKAIFSIVTPVDIHPHFTYFACMAELDKANDLFGEFESKCNRFDGLDFLSEALSITRDVLDSSDDSILEKRGNNFISTFKRFVISRANNIISEPKDYTFEQLDFWVKVLDEFISFEFDDSREIDLLHKQLSRHKERAKLRLTDDKDLLYFLDTWEKMTKQEQEEFMKELGLGRKQKDGSQEQKN